MEAAMNSAEASNSFSPFTLLKRPLERIHISKGMLKMRMSVMELGRFTLGAAPEASRISVLIILHRNRERNAKKHYVTTARINHRGHEGAQSFAPPCPRWRSVYFGAGDILSALGCLAIIRSLILS